MQKLINTSLEWPKPWCCRKNEECQDDKHSSGGVVDGFLFFRSLNVGARRIVDCSVAGWIAQLIYW